MEESDFVSDVDKAVARNIKQARERAGLSQAEVARLLTDAGVPAIHQTTIARIEKGDRKLRLAEALAIARILEYRVEDLAESSRSAALRESYERLQKLVHSVKTLAGDLLHEKLVLATDLDMKMPLTQDAAIATAEYIKVNPIVYDMLDELLSTNSDLSWVIGQVYEDLRAHLHRRVTPFENSRVLDLLSEAMANSWRPLQLRDLTTLPDDEFSKRVLDRFERGEHSEAP
ncbi:helix-turn-helix transcriptional regulator [Ruicaihuangia caeni]|nr:helix-turn-helix transcriptional regulator [Klugiella sp. YN-L-19]